ncbi:MAG: thioesterase family protein [Nocardioides sp.]|jgi:hypothetical protein
MDLVFFTADGDTLTPTALAASSWSKNQMHGLAVSGALARAIEGRVDELGRADMRPARITVDLFQPATMTPATVETTVLREGRRILMVEATLVQEDRRPARAAAIFLAPDEAPDGVVWEPSERPEAPDPSVVPESQEPRVPFLHSDIGWSQDFKAHQNSSRKTIWQVGIPIVEGEEPTPFQMVASLADSTSLVCNWGDQGVQFINTDLTVGISRLPSSREMGFRAVERTEQDGIAIGVAEVFDRDGLIGQSMVTSLVNAKRSVDFTSDEFNE